MTAVLAINLGDRVVVATDTAHFDAGGRVTRFGAKRLIVEAARAVLVVRGPAWGARFLAWLDDQGRPFLSDEDLWQRLGSEVQAFINELRPTVPPQGLDVFTLYVATCSANAGPRLGFLQGEYTPELVAQHELRPYHLWNVAEQNSGQDVIAKGAPAEPGMSLLAWFEAARARRCYPVSSDPNAFYGVGGSIQVTEIGLEGPITTRTVAQWAGDMIGLQLQPGEPATPMKEAA